MSLFCTSMADGLSVLTLGDSITAGGKSFFCYRQFLVPKLAGSEFKFIGPEKDNTSFHAGYSGRNTAYLRSQIKKIYRDFPADVVLIHSGHNSFSQDKPVAGIVSDTREMIQNIVSMNPKVTILLAQVIRSGKLPKYDYIPELNEALLSMSEEMRSKNYPVILVDQATGFDWREDTVSDKVHPNESGARKMADKWKEALESLKLL